MRELLKIISLLAALMGFTVAVDDKPPQRRDPPSDR